MRSEKKRMRKEEVLDILEKMPDEVDVDKLIYTLYLKRKLELAEADITAGRVIPHEEVEREMEAWRD